MTSSFLKTLLALLALALAGLTAASAQFITTPVVGGVSIIGYNGAAPANLVIPLVINGSAVVEIGAGAFQNQDTLTTLTLPTTLTIIRANAFRDCDNLGAVFIPASVASIGTGAFAACDRLASIEVDGTNGAYTSVDGVLYDLVTNAGNAILHQYPAGRPANSFPIPRTLPSTEPVISIADRAFEEAQNLLAIEIGASVAPGIQTIREAAFLNAARLVRVILNETVDSIGNNAFANNTGSSGPLAFATFLGNAPTSFGTNVFGGAAAGFEVRYLQGNTFGPNAFTAPTWQTYNSRIVQQTTNGELTYRVAGSAVEILSVGQTANQTLVIPSSIAGLPVRTIAANAFVGDANLRSVQLATSLTGIGQDAFYGCEFLGSVGLDPLYLPQRPNPANPPIPPNLPEEWDNTLSIPPNITNIGFGAFGACPLLTIIAVDPSNPSYRAEGNILFNKSFTSLEFCPIEVGLAELTNYDEKIPPSVVTIRERAFEGNRQISAIAFEDKVKIIERRAFYNNTALVTVRFGSSVTQIGPEAFATSEGALNAAIFYGNAPTGGANVFAGAPASFQLRYLQGATGFNLPPWSTYSPVVFNEDSDFEFTSSNGTIRITGYTGVPPRVGELAQVEPDISVRPVPNLVVTTENNRISLPQIYPVGFLVLVEDTNTIWRIVQTADGTNPRIWAVFNTGNARLNLNSNVSLGTTVIEQNDSRPIIYQKVANPGTNLSDWVEVNFQIPDRIAGLPVTEIAAGAFRGNALLQSVVLPETLTAIGVNAFADCPQLGVLQSTPRGQYVPGVFIPAGVTVIGKGAFANCGALEAIYVHELNPSYNGTEGVLFDRSRTVLHQYPSGRAAMSYAIPGTVKKIAAEAFLNNRYLVSLTFPDTLEVIEGSAFEGSQGLVSVTFGRGIKEIQSDAFRDIRPLGRAIFNGDAPAVVGTSVFDGASADFQIEYYQGFTGFSPPSPLANYKLQLVNESNEFQFRVVGTGANQSAEITGYSGTSSSIVIPATIGKLAVRSIGADAFAGKVGIVSVEIGNSITKIDARAFQGISTLQQVSFSNGLTTIEDEAFYGCTSLTFVSLPTTLSKIGDGAFAACDSLLAISIPASNQNFRTVEGVLFNKTGDTLRQYPAGLLGFSTTADSDYLIPSSVVTIGKQAFEGNKFLATLVIPPGVKTIKEKAFYNSESLVSVTIGRGVTTIESQAFGGISPPLNVALFYGNAPTAPNDLFLGIDPERFVVRYRPETNFPSQIVGGKWKGYPAEAVGTVDEGGFEFKIKPDSTVEITGYDNDAEIPLFRPDLTSPALRPQLVVRNQLERDQIPTTNSIGYKVLQLDNDTVYELTSVRAATENVPAQNVWSILIVDDLLGYTSVPLGSTIKQQNSNGPIYYQKVASPGSNQADWMLVSSRTLRIPATISELPVTSIADGAFEDATSLESIVIPGSIKTIGKNAFRGATRLGIPDNRLGNGVFLPATLEKVGDGAFSRCTGLSRIIAHPSNPNYTSVDGILFNKNLTQLVQYPAGKFVTANSDGSTVYSVPSQTQSIAAQAFEGNSNLNRIVIPNSVRSIGAYAFNEARSLTTVTLGGGLTSIGEFAFANNPGLTLVLFQGNAPRIPNADVFAGRSASLRLQFNARSTGFNLEPWLSLPIQAVWESGSGSGSVASTSSGFRAVGYVDPAEFNNFIGGQIQIAVSRSRIVSGVLVLGSKPEANGFFPTNQATSSTLPGILTSYRFRGEMDELGALSVSIPRRGAGNLELNLQFELLDAPTFFRLKDGSFLSDGLVDAPVFAGMIPWSRSIPAQPFAGIYNIAFDADTGGQPLAPGNGFAGLTVDGRTGAARLVGVLGDGTRFTGASWVLGDGSIPLWFPLYMNNGMLVGEMLLGPGGSSVSSDILWSKPADVPRSPDPDGFNEVLLTASPGSGRFVAPDLKSEAWRKKLEKFTLDFQGESLSGADFLQGFKLNLGSIVPDDPNLNQVRAAWNLRGGLVQGTFTIPDAGQPFGATRPIGRLGRFQGIILSDGRPESFQVRGNFVLPNSSTRPIIFYGGSVDNTNN